MAIHTILAATFVVAAATLTMAVPTDLGSIDRKKITCTMADPSCPKGRVCAGNEGNMRCVKPMQEGGFCKGDPFWVCDASLDCVDGVCRSRPIEKGESCTPPGSVCADGLVCAGKKKNKKCVKPMPEGGFCKGDPFWVCDEGLQCKKKICRKIPIEKGESCTPPGSVCASGLVCAGNEGNKKCVKPMLEGGFCKGDPFWVCDASLDCVDGVCRKVPIEKGESCTPPGSVCADGLVCAGKKKNKKCVKPMPEGGFCKGDPFWVCDSGLKCKKGKCVSV